MERKTVASHRILVIHQGALGDFVCFLPLAKGLRAMGRKIHIICRQPDLARFLNIFEKVFSADARAVSALYEGDIQPLHRTGLLQQVDRVLLVSVSDGLVKTLSKNLLLPVVRISPLPPASSLLHISDFLWEQALETKLVSDRVKPGSDSSIAAETFRNDPSLGHASETILVHPGSGSPRKNWPLNNFMALFQTLDKEKLNPKWLLGPAERADGEAFPKKRSIAPEGHLALANTLLLSRLIITNDSGVGHLAAFLGCPVVSIFGPSNPYVWAPRGPFVKVLRPDGLSCSPCFGTSPANCTAPACLSGTGVDDVVAVLKALL